MKNKYTLLLVFILIILFITNCKKNKYCKISLCAVIEAKIDNKMVKLIILSIVKNDTIINENCEVVEINNKKIINYQEILILKDKFTDKNKKITLIIFKRKDTESNNIDKVKYNCYFNNSFKSLTKTLNFEKYYTSNLFALEMNTILSDIKSKKRWE